MTDSVHLLSEPALANFRVSGFLQAAKALLFFAAGATPERSCFFFRGASTSATATMASRDETPLDDFEFTDCFAATAIDAAAGTDREGRVSGPTKDG